MLLILQVWRYWPCLLIFLTFHAIFSIMHTAMKTIAHYNDVIMSSMASQITSFTIVYSTVYSGVDHRNHQRSASLVCVRGIHRWPVNSPHKGPVTRKMFPFDDVIMLSTHQLVPLEYHESLLCCCTIASCHIIDFFNHFPAITDLLPTIKHLVYNINCILYLSHYPFLSIYSRRANQSQKILCIRHAFKSCRGSQFEVIYSRLRWWRIWDSPPGAQHVQDQSANGFYFLHWLLFLKKHIKPIPSHCSITQIWAKLRGIPKIWENPQIWVISEGDHPELREVTLGSPRIERVAYFWGWPSTCWRRCDAGVMSL